MSNNKQALANVFFGFRNNLNSIFNLFFNTTYITHTFMKTNEGISDTDSDNSGGVPPASNEPYYTMDISDVSNNDTFENPETNLTKFGHSISLSGDGNTLVVGSPGDSTNGGQVYIRRYDEDNEVWYSEYTTLSGSENFGFMVEVNRSNSSLIAIGNPSDGEVVIYQDSGSWNQISTIAITDGTIQSLSYSGDTIVIGTDTNTFVYMDMGTLGNPNFSLVDTLDVGIGTEGVPGHSVSISGDETKIVVGNPSENEVYIFENIPNTNSYILRRTFEGDTSGEQIGWAVKISFDGTTIIYSDPFANDKRGVVRVFIINELEEGNVLRQWEQIGDDFIGDENNDTFGWSLDISLNGFNFIVGAPQTSATTLSEEYSNVSGNGYVKVYEYRNFVWTETSNITQGTNNTGYSVTMDYYNYNINFSTNNNVIGDFVINNDYQLFDILTFPHMNGESGEEAKYYILKISSSGEPILRPITLGSGYVGSSTEARDFTTSSGTEYNFEIYFNQTGYNGEAPITDNDPGIGGVTITNAGRNYQVGNYIQVMNEEGDGTGGIYIVTDVNSSGGVTEVQRLFQGQNYESNSTLTFSTEDEGSGVELSFDYFTGTSVNIDNVTSDMYNASKTNKYYLDRMNGTSTAEEYWLFLYGELEPLIDNWIKTMIFTLEDCFLSIPNSFQYDNTNIMGTPISSASLYKGLLTTGNMTTRSAITQKFKAFSAYWSFSNSKVMSIYSSMFWGSNSPITMFIANDLKVLVEKMSNLDEIVNKMTNNYLIDFENVSQGQYNTLFPYLQEARSELIQAVIETGEAFQTIKNDLTLN